MLTFTPYASSSHGNLYTVDDGHSKVMIEMGIPIKEIRKALGFGLSEISFALLSHCHRDHSASVADVLKAGVDVYMSQGTADALNLSGHRVRICKPLQAFRVGTWTFMPLDVDHDAPDALAFVVVNSAEERLLFATDLPYLKYVLPGLNVIAIECNHSRDIIDKNVEAGIISPEQRHRTIRNHMSLETVKAFLKANDLSQVKEVWLTHLSGDNSDAERFKREVQACIGKPVYVAQE